MGSFDKKALIGKLLGIRVVRYLRKNLEQAMDELFFFSKNRQPTLSAEARRRVFGEYR